MNKKALYESIMNAVAKEVKKALNENNNEFSTYDEVELAAIHYYQIPDKFKGNVYGEEGIVGDNMSKSELINLITNVDWELMGKQYKVFFPNGRGPYYEGYIYDVEGSSMYDMLVHVNVPHSNIMLNLEVHLDWNHIPYTHETYWQPAEGGYAELDNYEIESAEIFVDEQKRFELTKEEISSYKLDLMFSDEIWDIAEDLDQSDDEYYQDNREYDPDEYWDD